MASRKDFCAQVREGLRAAAEEGRRWGNPPVGYRFVSGRPVAVESEQRILRLLDSLEGLTTRQAAEELRRRGITWRRGRAVGFQLIAKLRARRRREGAAGASP